MPKLRLFQDTGNPKALHPSKELSSITHVGDIGGEGLASRESFAVNEAFFYGVSGRLRPVFNV